MKISQKGIDFIVAHEGIRLKAYKCLSTEKYWTIGVGHYGADVTPGMVITRAQAEELLRKDLTKFEKNVNKYHSIYGFSQNQYDALMSFAYNVGSIDGLTAKGTRTKAQISEHITDYVKSGKVVISGLVKRRREEKALFDSDMSIVEQKTDLSQFPTLRRGDRGEYVKVMQQALNYHNIAGGQLVPDGIFGPASGNALVEFQALNGLKKDMICGPLTWAKLMRVS